MLFIVVKTSMGNEVRHEIHSVCIAVFSISITGDVESVDGVGDVKIGGNVTGNAHTSAGSIEVGGDVGGDVESACGGVTVKGNVAGNVDVSCGNVRIGK